MKVQINCSCLAVQSREFKGKDGKQVSFAVVTFAMEDDSSFICNVFGNETITALRNGKGKMVKWDFDLSPADIAGTYKMRILGK